MSGFSLMLEMDRRGTLCSGLVYRCYNELVWELVGGENRRDGDVGDFGERGQRIGL